MSSKTFKKLWQINITETECVKKKQTTESLNGNLRKNKILLTTKESSKLGLRQRPKSKPNLKACGNSVNRSQVETLSTVNFLLFSKKQTVHSVVEVRLVEKIKTVNRADAEKSVRVEAEKSVCTVHCVAVGFFVVSFFDFCFFGFYFRFGPLLTESSCRGETCVRD